MICFGTSTKTCIMHTMFARIILRKNTISWSLRNGNFRKKKKLNVNERGQLKTKLNLEPSKLSFLGCDLLTGLLK